MIRCLYSGKSSLSGIMVYGVPVQSVNDRVYIIHGATEDAINTINEVDFIYTEVVPDSVKKVIGCERVVDSEVPETFESDLKSKKLDRIEKVAILKTLKSCNGYRKQAARILGISERKLYRKISDYKAEKRNRLTTK